MTTPPLTPQQAQEATDEIMAAAKLYERYLKVSGVNDVLAYNSAEAVETAGFFAPRSVPLTFTFNTRR